MSKMQKTCYHRTNGQEVLHEVRTFGRQETSRKDSRHKGQERRKMNNEENNTMDFVHGLSGYRCGCRCILCKIAKREENRKYGERKREFFRINREIIPHGTDIGYRLGKCRCESCRKYHREMIRNYKERKRETHGYQ